jgi:cobyrinic acid a,c-diamide synthase
LLDLTSQARRFPQKLIVPLQAPNQVYKIAVARDDAFSFTYYENIEALKRMGEVIFFSPLKDEIMPACDLLYLAGGYPELFLEELSSNTSMLNSVYMHCFNHGKTYAECGGMMYLGKSITDKHGKVFNMAGFLPVSTSMENPKLHLGYRSVIMDEVTIKGHEFHYSTCNELEDVCIEAWSVKNAKGLEVDSKIYRKASTLASYIHLYWGEDQSFLHKILEVC